MEFFRDTLTMLKKSPDAKRWLFVNNEGKKADFIKLKPNDNIFAQWITYLTECS